MIARGVLFDFFGPLVDAKASRREHGYRATHKHGRHRESVVRSGSLPDHRSWSGPSATFDLDGPGERRVVYATVLREGSASAAAEWIREHRRHARSENLQVPRDAMGVLDGLSRSSLDVDDETVRRMRDEFLSWRDELGR